MKKIWAILLAVVVGGLFIWVGNVLPRVYVEAADRAGILLGLLAILFSIGMGAYAWQKRWEIRRWFLQPTAAHSFDEFDANQVKGMVIPVSREEQPKWILFHLKPQVVAFLYTSQSEKTAKALQDEFQENIQFISPTRPLSDPFNPKESYEAVLSYLQQLKNLGLRSEEIFVDTTGGTVPMSIGCFMAAEKEGISSIYVVGTRADGKIENPSRREHGKPIFLKEYTYHSGE